MSPSSDGTYSVVSGPETLALSVGPSEWVLPENGAQSSLRNKNKTPWPLVRERTIPTEQPPLGDEI
jgi:hypothetical protein